MKEWNVDVYTVAGMYEVKGIEAETEEEARRIALKHVPPVICRSDVSTIAMAYLADGKEKRTISLPASTVLRILIHLDWMSQQLLWQKQVDMVGIDGMEPQSPTPKEAIPLSDEMADAVKLLEELKSAIKQ